MDIMRQSACLVVNQTTVYSYGILLNCKVGAAKDKYQAPTNGYNHCARAVYVKLDITWIPCGSLHVWL